MRCNGRSNNFLTSPPTNSLDETNLSGGNLVGTGTLFVDFGNDGPGTILPDGNVTVECSLANNKLSSKGVDVTISPTTNGYEGFAGSIRLS